MKTALKFAHGEARGDRAAQAAAAQHYLTVFYHFPLSGQSHEAGVKADYCARSSARIFLLLRSTFELRERKLSTPRMNGMRRAMITPSYWGVWRS